MGPNMKKLIVAFCNFANAPKNPGFSRAEEVLYQCLFN
jgi:hypothetical protein